MKAVKFLVVFVAIFILTSVTFLVNSYSDDNDKVQDSTKSKIRIKNTDTVIKEPVSNVRAVVKQPSVKGAEQISKDVVKKPVQIQTEGLGKGSLVNQGKPALNQSQALENTRRDMQDARSMEAGKGILPENMANVGQVGTGKDNVMNPREHATSILGGSQVQDSTTAASSGGRRQPGDKLPSRDDMIGQRTSPQDRAKNVTAPLDMGKSSVKGSLLGKGTGKYSEEGDEGSGGAGEPSQPSEPPTSGGSSEGGQGTPPTSGGTTPGPNYPPMDMEGKSDPSDPDYVNSLSDAEVKAIVDAMPVPPLPNGGGANDPDKPHQYMTPEERAKHMEHMAPDERYEHMTPKEREAMDIDKEKMPSESGEGDGTQIRGSARALDKINKYKTPAPEGSDRASGAVTESLHPKDQGAITNPGDNAATGSGTTIDDYIAKPDEGDPQSTSSDDDQ